MTRKNLTATDVLVREGSKDSLRSFILQVMKEEEDRKAKLGFLTFG